MNKDSKKILLIVSVIVIAIVLLAIFTNEKKKEENKVVEKVETLELSQVMEIEDIEKSETLYGESSQTVKIPLSESIYRDNRLYSKTYEKEGKTYDINFYKNGEKINCELVYKIQ